MKTAEKNRSRNDNRRRQAPRRSRGKVWPLIVLIAAVTGIGIGYAYVRDTSERAALAEINDQVVSPAEERLPKAGRFAEKRARVVKKERTPVDPVPVELIVPDSMLSALESIPGNIEYISLGDTTVRVEPKYVVQDGDGLVLTAGRRVRTLDAQSQWNIIEALSLAGHGDRQEEFSEIAQLTLADQLDVVLSTTEEHGLYYDYSVNEDAMMAVKRSLVGEHREIFQFYLSGTHVVQIGRVGTGEPVQLYVSFASGQTRAFDVIDNAQESIYWLISRFEDPDPNGGIAARVAAGDIVDEGADTVVE